MIRALNGGIYTANCSLLIATKAAAIAYLSRIGRNTKMVCEDAEM